MNKQFRTLLLATGLALLVVWRFPAQPAQAQLTNGASVDTTDVSEWELTLVPTECQTGDGCDICEVTKIFTNAADIVASLLSGIALLTFVIGGLFLIFSGGNPSRVETGKKILIGTISGLAIIFLAWITVNIIVRTASITGGTSDTTPFTPEWWEFKNCYPTLPSVCSTHFVGEACSTTTCTSTSQDPNCFCYRATGSGDTKCGGETDATSLDSVMDEDKNKNKQCICTDTCSVLAKKTEKAYTCVLDATIEKAKAGTYTKRPDATCVTSGTTCALLNTTK